MKRTYIDPKVKLLQGDSTSLGFFTWMKSRREIIEDSEGNLLMMDLEYSENWMDELPEEFIVGSELVNKHEYAKRIDNTNLQYNNFDNFILELNCSALFRDLLFNLDDAAWATSNRFLFSILDKEEVYNPEHYHISSEYKGIKVWEDQFDKYMESIKINDRVDVNRKEMPYSISSYVWFGCNKRTLLSILNTLKLHFPFFYEIYGKLIMDEMGIDESSLNGSISTKVLQNFRTENSSNVEGVEYVGDYVYVTTKMGLIMYSQFIRQSDSIIQGFYDLVSHSDPEEFKNKVFKGSTEFLVNFMSTKAKVDKTISNRLCAFAMSSGDDPCSWSYFIKQFYPNGLTGRELAEKLPCSYRDTRNGGLKMTNCKYYEDIKFRQEGKERSNSPCPLIDVDMDLARSKQKVDNNFIGDAYVELTKLLKHGGLLQHEYTSYYWTSNLQILTDKELNHEDFKLIDEWLKEIDELYTIGELHNLSELEPYLDYGLGNDVICMMKGLAIDFISNELHKMRYKSFLINFGGDIYGYNTNSIINIDNSDVDLELNGRFSVFTSGNDEVRGQHINIDEVGSTSTVVKVWDSSTKVNNILMDILATKIYAEETSSVENLEDQFDLDDYYVINLDENRMFTDRVYCASPFFNPHHIQVRDEMISKFKDAFRPDLTDNSKLFNEDHTYDLVQQVVDDNINGITSSKFLVFPVNTSDLGTLYEVGVAMYYKIPIIKFSNRYSIVFDFEVKNKIDPKKNYLFNCGKKDNAISLGYASCILDPSKIFYELRGSNDNIMMSAQFTHIEQINNSNNYEILIRDEADTDK